MKSGPQRRHLLWLAAIVALGVLPRLYQVEAPLYVNGHAWRQADSAAFVDGYLQHGLNLFSPRVAQQPCDYFDEPFGAVESELPVIAWLSALPLAAVGEKWAPPWYLRLISIAMYALASVWLFALAARFSGVPDQNDSAVDYREALFAAAAFATFPIAIFYSRSPQPDAPSLLFVIAFVFHLDRWLCDRRGLDAGVAAVAGAVGLLIKVSNAYILLVGLYLVLRRRSWRSVARDWRMWLFAALVLVPAIAWYRYAASAYSHTFDIWTWRKFTEPSDYLDLQHWKWFGLRFAFPVLTLAGCALSIVGVVRGRAPQLPRIWFVACFAFLLLAIKANRTHVYYQLIFVVPASLACAKAAVWLLKRRVWGRFALSGLLAVHLAIGSQVLFDREDPGELWGYFHIDLPTVHEAVELLGRTVPEGERLVAPIIHPAIFVGARRFAYTPRAFTVHAVVSCMQRGVSYALVPGDWRDPPSARVVGRSTGLKVWHRVPVETFGRLRLDGAP